MEYVGCTSPASFQARALTRYWPPLTMALSRDALDTNHFDQVGASVEAATNQALSLWDRVRSKPAPGSQYAAGPGVTCSTRTCTRLSAPGAGVTAVPRVCSTERLFDRDALMGAISVAVGSFRS